MSRPKKLPRRPGWPTFYYWDSEPIGNDPHDVARKLNCQVVKVRVRHVSRNPFGTGESISTWEEEIPSIYHDNSLTNPSCWESETSTELDRYDPKGVEGARDG